MCYVMLLGASYTEDDPIRIAARTAKTNKTLAALAELDAALLALDSDRIVRIEALIRARYAAGLC